MELLMDPGARDSREPQQPSLPHALRGKLQAIKWCVELIQPPGSLEERLEFLDHLERSADQFLHLLDEAERTGNWTPM
jgi:hypothetical protein